jgi:hypothetical protein
MSERVYSLFMYLSHLTLQCQPQCNVGTFISSCPASLSALCGPKCIEGHWAIEFKPHYP